MSILVIPKEDSPSIIDWEANPVVFRSKKTVKNTEFKSYSKYIQDAIMVKFGVKVTNKAGTHVGSRDVAIYLQCEHKVAFECSIKARNFKPNQNLEFTLYRSKNENCECRKFV